MRGFRFHRDRKPGARKERPHTLWSQMNSSLFVALVYHFLRERNLLGGDAGQRMLGAAMVVDVLSMISPRK